MLSPLLFNIYLKDLGRQIDSQSNILQYADDIVIFAASRNLDLATASVQRSVERVSRYLWTRGLEVAPNKLQIMLFNRRRSIAVLPPSISCEGLLIPVVREARFLGVWLDERLEGRCHLLYLIRKCRKITDVISSLSGVRWGSHPSLLLTVYRSVLRSVIEYMYTAARLINTLVMLSYF